MGQRESNEPRASGHKRVTVIMTVKNDADACEVTLSSLAAQTRPPDEIVVTDGGSTDYTLSVIRRHAASNERLRLVEAPGTNIARGRNLAARSASGEIIASIDAGCRAEPEWLERLIAPFEADEEVDFVGGFYRIEPRTLLEKVVGLVTMRGQLDPVDPKTFNPSARSMACTKELWERAGGWPEWLSFSEDTLFDHKVRGMSGGWRFAGDAVVHWRPRTTLWAVGKQFYGYGTGRGHTQINAPSYLYNLRNVVLVFLSALASLLNPWFFAACVALAIYFYVWAFHGVAVRVAKRTGNVAAYPLSLLVTWIVLGSGLLGYLVGSHQRRRTHRLRASLQSYIAGVEAA